MKLKEILLENVNDNIWRKFLEDCAAFIEINESKLKNGYYLYRGTSSYDRNVIKKRFRQRDEVHGSSTKTWAYEHFKPNDYPSREDMIPTFGGEMSYNVGSEVHLVFPIDYNYKLQYTRGLDDFNDDDNPIGYKNSPFNILMKVLDDEKFPDYLRDKARAFRREGGKYGYDEIRNFYGNVWDLAQKAASYDEDLREKLEAFKVEVGQYFQKSEVSKEMPGEKEIEVGLYAPQGFYYVKPDVLEHKSLF